MRIGEFLLKNSVISDSMLERALKKQKATGAKIGEELQNLNLKPITFYQNLAKNLSLDFVHLENSIIDKNLIEKTKQQLYESLEFLPISCHNGITKIATHNPKNKALLEYLQSEYQSNSYQIVITTRRDFYKTLSQIFDEEYKFNATELLHQEASEFSAQGIFKSFNISLLLFMMALAVGLYLNFGATFFAIFMAMNVIYFLNTLFKNLLFLFGSRVKNRPTSIKKALREGILKSPPLIKVSDSEIASLDEEDLPIYTLLIPLYKEGKVTIINLLANISGINYPKHKLDVKLILEADDEETQNLIKQANPEYFFEIVLVPHSKPKTKPKACNYALNFARGELIAIYDAEDKPDVLQLKKAAYIFQEDNKIADKKGENLGCIQASLNFYNHNENLLTKLFAMEYATLFNFFLPAINALKLPVPLGGTSNHFRKDVLEDIHNWDSYNVTEDADIGVRLKQKNYQMLIMQSETLEEATITKRAWLHQRARWIKGFIQTFLVHMRKPLHFIKSSGIYSVAGFFMFIGSPVLIFLSLPLLLALGVGAIFLEVQTTPLMMYIAFCNLALSVLSHLIKGVAVVNFRRDLWKIKDMRVAILTFPFYPILHSMAAFQAIYDIITSPYKWNKTTHGVSKMAIMKEMGE